MARVVNAIETGGDDEEAEDAGVPGAFEAIGADPLEQEITTEENKITRQRNPNKATRNTLK